MLDPFYVRIVSIAVMEIAAFTLIGLHYSRKKRKMLPAICIVVLSIGMVGLYASLPGAAFWRELAGLAWSAFLVALGTTGLGFFVSNIVVFLATLGITYAVMWWRQGPEAMKSHAAENLEMGILIYALVLLTVFIPIYGYQVFVTIPRQIRNDADGFRPRVVVTLAAPPTLAAAQKRISRISKPNDLLPPTPPMFSEAQDEFHISGGTLTGSIKNGKSTCLVDVAGRCLVKGYVENGRFFADADIVVDGPNVDVQLTKNKLHKNIPAWDRCFNSTALEVVDENLLPMFQIIYTTPHDIVIYGFFKVDSAVYLFSPRGFISRTESTPVTASDYPVQRIFSYPSRKTRCKEADSSAPTTQINKNRPYASLGNGELCSKVIAEAYQIYAMADRCLEDLEGTTGPVPKVTRAPNDIRKEFSNNFWDCCWQTVSDMHDELILRLKPVVESKEEDLFREVVDEHQNHPTGIVLTAVENLSVYLRNLCGQLGN